MEIGWMIDRTMSAYTFGFLNFFLGGMVSMNDGSMSGVEALSLVVEKSDVIKETYLTASLLGR